MDNDFIPRKVYRTFDGREQEIRMAIDFLQDEGPLASRVLLVHGPRGIGKTALIWHISHWVASNEESVRKFKNLLWIDRSNFDVFLEAFDNLEDDINSDESIAKPSLYENGKIVPVSRAFASKANSRKMLAENKKKTIRYLMRNKPCLIIVDDFDEQNPLTAIQDVCEKLERISEYPNKVIVTARSSYLHEFDDLALRKLEIGLLSKEEFVKNVKNSLKNYSGDLDEVVSFLWEVTVGHAELTNKFMIPILEDGRYLLSDRRIDSFLEKFVQSYIFEMEQPKKLSGYLSYNAQIDESLKELLESLSSFSKLVLWNWLNLSDPTIVSCFSEDQLGTYLGYVMEHENMRSDLHIALQELFEKRLLSKRFEPSSKSLIIKARTEWVLLPPIFAYLKKHWLVTNEILENEVSHIVDFLNWYRAKSDDKEIGVIENVLNRCCFLAHWFYEKRHYEVLDKLLGSVFEFFVNRNRKNGISHLDLVDLLEIQIDILKKKEPYSLEGNEQRWALLGKLFYILGEYEQSKYCLDKAIFDVETTCEAIDVISTKSRIAIFDNSLEEASNLLGNVKQECVNALWVEAVFQLATQYAKCGSYHESIYWYSSIVLSFKFHSDVFYSLKACCQIARLVPMNTENEIAQLVEVLRIGSNLAHIKSNQEMYPEVSACALCWYAACLEYQGDKDNARTILEYARSEIVKPYIPASPLGLFVEERLIFMSQLNITSLINGLMDIPIDGDVSYKFEHSYNIGFLKGKCLICRGDFENTNIKNIIKCKKCEVYYHQNCFIELGSSSCPNCNNVIGVDYVS